MKINNSKLSYEDLEQENKHLVTENEKLLHQLKSYESKLIHANKLINQSLDLLATIDQNGTIIDINTIIEKITGFTQSEVIGRSIFDFIHNTVSLKDAIQQAKQSDLISGFEFLMFHKNQTEKLFLCNLYKIKAMDHQFQYFLEARDVTKNTNYENELEIMVNERTNELNKTLSLLTSSLESPKDMIIMAVDHNYKYLYFNQVHKNIMKLTYDVDVKEGMNVLNCISSKIDQEHAKENYDLALKGISHTTIQEYGDRIKSYYESNYNPIYNQDHEVIGMCVFARDITERTNMQNKLKDYEKQMELFFNQSLTGFFIMMLDQPITWNQTIDKEKALDYIFNHQFTIKYNKAYLKQYGYTDKDVLHKTPNTVFEHNIVEGRKAWKKMLDHKYAHIITHERKKDGTPIIIEGDYICMYDDQGRFIGHFGTQIDVTKRVERIEKIEHMNKYDYLTDVYNRKYFMDFYHRIDLNEVLPLGLMMIDINGLKILNDAYGIDTGDEKLKYVADVLKSVTRKKDLVARIGGDEFILFIPHTDKDKLYKIKETLIRKIKSRSTNDIKLSVTVGFELMDQIIIDRNEFLHIVENRMYAKKSIEASSSRNSAIQAIIKTLNVKYKTEKRHLNRVSKLCAQIGTKLGLNDDQIKELEMAGLYHDIGKISIPDRILNKPGRLTDEEYEIMKTHAEIGYQILKTADAYSDLAIYARHHHERWDGKGYPAGLSGTRIPLYSRIIGCVDAYEAMTSDRPYRSKMSKADAVAEIIRHSGTQFDPEIAKILVVNILGSKWIKN